MLVLNQCIGVMKIIRTDINRIQAADTITILDQDPATGIQVQDREAGTPVLDRVTQIQAQDPVLTAARGRAPAVMDGVGKDKNEFNIEMNYM